MAKSVGRCALRTCSTPHSPACSLPTAACERPDDGRTGAAFPLTSDPPVSACERADWYEVAPAFVRARASTSQIFASTYYKKVYEGLGVFRGESSEPEDLDDLWAKMNEPDLERRHEARTAPVDAARLRSGLFEVGGGLALLGGAGVYAGVNNDSPTAADVALGTGLVVGLAGVVAFLLSQPSGHDQLEANARHKLFVGDEDDQDAIMRGVSRANMEVRRQCGTPAAGAAAAVDTGGAGALPHGP